MPSPNMPTPDTALVYPGMCLLEGTNLSEGRGTTRPFELFGAPWLDGYALAEALDGEQLAGVFASVPAPSPHPQDNATRKALRGRADSYRRSAGARCGPFGSRLHRARARAKIRRSSPGGPSATSSSDNLPAIDLLAETPRASGPRWKRGSGVAELCLDWGSRSGRNFSSSASWRGSIEPKSIAIELKSIRKNGPARFLRRAAALADDSCVSCWRSASVSSSASSASGGTRKRGCGRLVSLSLPRRARSALPAGARRWSRSR